MKKNRKNKPVYAFLAVILLPLSLIFTSCEDESQAENPSAYIGGEIVNPNSDHLLLFRNGKMLDTIFLNDRNRFSYKIDNPARGIYLLKHRPENQPVYLQPGDSLLLRANTFAFDESLHFSGKGEARNNFLTQMYLDDEKTADLLLSFYKTNPHNFASKTDSIKQARLTALEKVNKKHELSEDFLSIAKKIINYENYDLRERYIYLVNRYNDKFSTRLPEGFLNHREKVSFNEADLQSYPGYRRFIENYLVNYSYETCIAEENESRNCQDFTAHGNISSRIKKVDELIQLPALKNYFLSKLGVLGIVMAREEEEIDKTLDLLKESGIPQKELSNLEQLGILQLTYLPGTRVSTVPLIRSSGDTIQFKEVIKKPTIVFLWSIYSREHKQYHDLIDEMRKKYPEINFVGINMDIGEVSKWRLALNKYGYDPEMEFQVGRTRIKKEFFQYYLNKLLFLDSTGKVIIGDAFINSPQFETRILEFLNQ